MTSEDKENLYAILYGRFSEIHAELEAIKAVLFAHQKAQLQKLIPAKKTELCKSGSLDVCMDFLRQKS